MNHFSEKFLPADPSHIQLLINENRILKKEIRTAHEAAEITANLVVRQFEETEKILRRFQSANAQRKAVLNSASQISIIATNIKGIITVFNTGAENLLGYRSQEIIGKHTPIMFHLESEIIEQSKKLGAESGRIIKGFDVFLELAMRDGSYQREWTYVRKDGTLFPVNLSINSLRGPEGAVTGLLGIATDISEKKHSEKELQESERKYRSLFAGGPNPIFVISKETLEIFDVNPMAEEIYGYTRNELIGRPCAELCTAEGKGMLPCKTGVKIGECVEEEKVRHYKKGKKPFYVKIKTCPTSYKDKEAFILGVTDITEMMEKDALLMQAGKMTTLGEMSAGIAHELNQPLAAIKLGNEFMKMMIEQGRDIPEQHLSQVVREINTQVDRATDIIQRLRAFGRKPDYVKDIKQININNAIRSVLDIIGQQLNLQNIKVDSDLNENLPSILARDNLVDQVIFNLITNARDAINHKKKTADGTADVITIRSFLEHNHMAAVTVSDTGDGIPEDVRDKIFEPFFTTKEVGSGMGLGLSIIYGIVKDIRGTIEVQSREGKGSTFKLAFPGYWEDIPT